MARTSKGPWFRKSTGWWMTTVGGRQHKLAEGRHNRQLAVQRFHELMLVVSQSPDAVNVTVLTVCELFLSWAQRHRSAETQRGYKFYLQSFAEECGYLAADELKPYHVQAWVDDNPAWKQTTHFNAIGTVLRAFNWAAQQGVVTNNPIAGMKRPRPKSRRLIIERATYLRLRRAARPEFKYFLTALWETGARPCELRTLKWSQVKGDRFVLEVHKTSEKVDLPRVIWLSPLMQRLMACLRERAAGNDECVFANMYGRPWTTSSVRLAIKRLREQLQMEEPVMAYAFRHTFVTRAILSGVSEITLAELVGHRDLSMIHRVYAHLAEQTAHLREALHNATRRRLPQKN